MASSLPSTSKHRNTPPCWPAVDDLLCERLSVLHHSPGSYVVDSAAAAAEDFSHMLGALLLEQGIISAATTRSGPHRCRPTESALKNLSHMKNTAHKFIHYRCDKFLNLVRAHHTVKKCHSKQQYVNSVSRNKNEFRKNPWQYDQKNLLPSKDHVEPSFTVSSAVSHFSQTYSDSNTNYQYLPSWITDMLPNCIPTLLNVTPITPSLVKATLRKCSMGSAPGWDGITYYHLNHLPTAHHFMGTLFNKLLEKGVSPACWGSARIKLIYKSGDPSDPSNFRPIALTSVVGNSSTRSSVIVLRITL